MVLRVAVDGPPSALPGGPAFQGEPVDVLLGAAIEGMDVPAPSAVNPARRFAAEVAVDVIPPLGDAMLLEAVYRSRSDDPNAVVAMSGTGGVLWQLRAASFGHTSRTNNFSVEPRVWHHVLCYADPLTVRCAVDGSVVESNVSGSVVPGDRDAAQLGPADIALLRIWTPPEPVTFEDIGNAARASLLAFVGVRHDGGAAHFNRPSSSAMLVTFAGAARTVVTGADWPVVFAPPGATPALSFDPPATPLATTGMCNETLSTELPTTVMCTVDPNYQPPSSTGSGDQTMSSFVRGACDVAVQFGGTSICCRSKATAPSSTSRRVAWQRARSGSPSRVATVPQSAGSPPWAVESEAFRSTRVASLDRRPSTCSARPPRSRRRTRRRTDAVRLTVQVDIDGVNASLLDAGFNATPLLSLQGGALYVDGAPTGNVLRAGVTEEVVLHEPDATPPCSDDNCVSLAANTPVPAGLFLGGDGERRLLRAFELVTAPR